jgi:hypothetical protein
MPEFVKIDQTAENWRADTCARRWYHDPMIPFSLLKKGMLAKNTHVNVISFIHNRNRQANVRRKCITPNSLRHFLPSEL